MILQVPIRLNICNLHTMKYLLPNSGTLKLWADAAPSQKEARWHGFGLRAMPAGITGLYLIFRCVRTPR